MSKSCPKCGHKITDMKYGCYNSLILKLPDAPVAWVCVKCGWDSEEDHPPAIADEDLVKEYYDMMCYEQSLHKIPLSKAVEVEYTNRFGTVEKRTVCPICAEHQQGSSSDVHDCKVEFTKDVIKNGLHMQITVGQCCCYSTAHLRRKKQW